MTLAQVSSSARRHPQLSAGLAVLLLVVAFGPVGSLFVDTDLARVASAEPDTSPFGGLVDTLIRGAADVLLTIPGLLFLVVLAASLHTTVTVDMMAIVVASLAWMLPTRTIRSQVLSMRERGYVQVARLSGMGDLEIIARELLPNLLPYLAASFVSAVGAAVLASSGLEALGLGPQNEPTLGMTIYWALYYTSLLRGIWWWWAPPMVMIVLIFVGLFLISMGLARIANPRLWRTP